MTLLQLEYIIAVDTYKSFILAAEKSFITQPTLSMQIQKLEASLNIKILIVVNNLSYLLKLANKSSSKRELY